MSDDYTEKFYAKSEVDFNPATGKPLHAPGLFDTYGEARANGEAHGFAVFTVEKVFIRV